MRSCLRSIFPTCVRFPQLGISEIVMKICTSPVLVLGGLLFSGVQDFASCCVCKSRKVLHDSLFATAPKMLRQGGFFIPQGCATIRKDLLSYLVCSWSLMSNHVVVLRIRPKLGFARALTVAHISLRCSHVGSNLNPWFKMRPYMLVLSGLRAKGLLFHRILTMDAFSNHDGTMLRALGDSGRWRL